MGSESDPLGLVGTTILDKYAVEAVVGQGGFAIVYRAQHTLWKRPVAVKVFNALGEVAADQRERLLADFIQEGALLAELSERSTAICQARDVGMLKTPKGDQVPYMVLEWLEGKSLDAVLEDERARGARLRSLAEAVQLLAPVAEALDLAHKKGIAHRDVKPANVFVLGDAADPSGVKLLDFGIAKVVQDAQKMGFGKTAGHLTSFTPLYGAPEQFNRQYGATGPWTDVFALALVVAEVVSGKEPMPGETIVQLAYAASDPDRRPTPRALGVVIGDAAEAVLAKAVAVKPEDRWKTAGELWVALSEAVRGDLGARISSERTAAAAPASGLDATEMAPPPSMPSAPSPVAETSPGAPAALAPPPPKSRTPVAIAIVAVVAVGAAAGFAALRGGVSGADVPGGVTSAPPGPSAKARASASASVAPAPSCPAGMVYVPGGEFFMGSDEKDADASEKPAHKVKLSPYCLDELEVTVEAYKACSDRGACKRAGKENEWPGIKPAQRKIYDPLCNINAPAEKAKHPINCVDWSQASSFCAEHGGRLPTEAEWEFAARGPDGRIYPWGDDPPSGKLLNACGTECVAWAKKHPDPLGLPSAMYAEDDGFPNTAPVGSFPAGRSRYGIQDVVGNVWEWVSDRYAPYEPEQAKTTLTDPRGPSAGDDRVIRGGAWNGYMPSWVRPSFRFHAAPSARSYGFGFRCAKSP